MNSLTVRQDFRVSGQGSFVSDKICTGNISCSSNLEEASHFPKMNGVESVSTNHMLRPKANETGQVLAELQPL